MGIRVLRAGIVAVIGGNQGNPGLPGHAQEVLVDQLLVLKPVILHLQEEIPVTKYLPVGNGSFLCLFIKAPGKKPGNLARKAGRGTDQPFMVLPEHLLVHARPVIESFLKSC